MYSFHSRIWGDDDNSLLSRLFLCFFFTCLSLHVFVFLSVCLYVCLSIWLLICFFGLLVAFLCIYLFIYLFIYCQSTLSSCQVVPTDRCWYNSLQIRHESWWRPAHSQLVQVWSFFYKLICDIFLEKCSCQCQDLCLFIQCSKKHNNWDREAIWSLHVILSLNTTQVYPAMGEWVHWLPEGVGRVCLETPRGKCPEQVRDYVHCCILACPGLICVSRKEIV